MGKKTIILDPGHGVRKGSIIDPGVVYGSIKESDVALYYALTCKEIWKDTYDVVLTRTEEEGPPYINRTRMKGDLFLSLHLNIANSYGMVYYKSLGLTKYIVSSKRLADIIQNTAKLKFVKPTTESRFGRLYIDDFPFTSVLVEIDAINLAPNTREARIEFAQKLLTSLNTFFNV